MITVTCRRRLLVTLSLFHREFEEAALDRSGSRGRCSGATPCPSSLTILFFAGLRVSVMSTRWRAVFRSPAGGIKQNQAKS
jgi:hypothetical protein